MGVEKVDVAGVRVEVIFIAKVIDVVAVVVVISVVAVDVVAIVAVEVVRLVLKNHSGCGFDLQGRVACTGDMRK